MYALMAKCEELSVTMEPVYKLAHQMYPLELYFPVYVELAKGLIDRLSSIPLLSDHPLAIYIINF